MTSRATNTQDDYIILLKKGRQNLKFIHPSIQSTVASDGCLYSMTYFI